MYILLIIIHVLVCFLMVGAILLQSGKGAEIGASFGGSSQTVFGSRGPANFLSKFTVVVAAIFMLTSLTYFYDRRVYPPDGLTPDTVLKDDQDGLKFTLEHLR